MSGLPFTLRQLEVFERLCASRSFRSASEELGISQAAVSNQIKALEEQMGLRLFTRDSGKRPGLTPEGAAFLADLAPFREAANALGSHRRQGPPEEEPDHCDLKVLVGLQLLDDFIRPALGGFVRDHSEIQLHIDTDPAFDSPRQALARGGYDIGLFSEQADNPLGENLAGLSRVICGVFGHRKFLEGREGPLSPAELEDIPFVLPSAGSFHESEVLKMLAAHGIRPGKILGRTQYYDVMLAMCETGTAVGVSLLSLVKPEQRNNVRMLHRLSDWRLTLYRNPASPQPQAEAAVRFLTTSVVDNPAYPAFMEGE